MMTAVMLLTMSELVMAGDGEHVGCLVNWEPQAFFRGGQTRSGLSDMTGSSGRNEGHTAFREATRMMMEEHPGIDFSVYDWNGDGNVEQVVYVYAGNSGNQSTIQNEGYVWPTTGSFSSISTKDGHKISHYTASGELWVNDTSCGIGIICHEFSHCLGLPDIYPIFDDICITDITTQTDASMSFAFHTSGSGIFHLKAEPRATGVYTLSGQKLRDFGLAFTPLFRGVFIINGKKKIVH